METGFTYGYISSLAGVDNPVTVTDATWVISQLMVPSRVFSNVSSINVQIALCIKTACKCI